MGIFSGHDPQRYFDGTSFVVSRTLFSPPALSMLPAVYVDDDAREWAVRLPGAQPRILGFSEILGAEVVEDDGEQERHELETAGRTRFQKTLLNPQAVSKANAAAKGKMCFGLGVAVAVRGAEVPLQITLTTHAMRKDSAAYAQLRDAAEGLKHDFDEMASMAEG